MSNSKKMVKRALLIGSNYTAIPSAKLFGCINDIINMRNTLIDAYGYQDANIYMLRDDDTARMPTRANILSALSQLVALSTSSDILWIHYSGHGTQIRDTNKDEMDGFDECIVPCNYNTAGIITDDELYAIFKNAKCQLMICLDSCNSGTGCDLQYSMNYSNGALIKSTNNSSRAIPNPNVIMLSGCRDNQTSADAYDTTSQKNVGAFTHTFLETLRGFDHNAQILQVYTTLCAKLKQYGFTQIPVLSSSVSLPGFQFTRVNANNVSVTGFSTNTASVVKPKDFVLNGNNKLLVASNPATKSIRGLMSQLIN